MIECLEGRRLLSVSAPWVVLSRPAAAASPAGIAGRAAAPAAIDVSGAYTGTARLRPAVKGARATKYPLTLTLTDNAGAVTGSASLSGLADFTFTGTLAGRRLTATVDGGGGQLVASFPGRQGRVAGKLVGVALNGQTYNGKFTAKNPSAVQTGGGGTGTGNGTGGGSTGGTSGGTTPGTLPRPDHVVIVVEENHSYSQVLGTATTGTPGLPGVLPGDPGQVLNRDDYIRSLAAGGASFTNASAETHPSQPNYLALFSGSTQGVTSDATPKNVFPGPDLGGELIAAGQSFAGYSEDLPSVGFTGDTSGDYARKHNPWVDFADVPASANLPFTRFPQTAEGYTNLPTVSFVIPNQQNDMHSGSIAKADQWLKDNLGGYAQWAQSHNSLLIVTWDEGSGDNHIATIFSGQPVKPGNYPEPVDHYRMLRTLQDMYGLTPTAHAAQRQAITDVWR